MRLTLHIGTPQCGGATLQSYLEQLGESVSPLSPGQESMGLLLLGRTDEAQKLYSDRCGKANPDEPERLKDKLADCGLEHVIISNVFLSGVMDQEFIGNVALELDEIFDEMQAVVYLQHQVRDFPRLINQRVKSGMSNWESIRRIPAQQYKYDELCRRWEQDIDLIARDFGRCERSVVEDFCTVVGIDPSLARRNNTSNDVFDDVALGLMVQINNCAHPAKEHIRRRIARNVERMQLSDRAPELGDDLIESLRQQFEDGNTWVSERYFGGVPFLS